MIETLSECPLCDARIINDPDACPKCRAALDYSGDFENGSWHRFVQATPQSKLSEGMWCIIVATALIAFGVIAFIVGLPDAS